MSPAWAAVGVESNTITRIAATDRGPSADWSKWRVRQRIFNTIASFGNWAETTVGFAAKDAVARACDWSQESDFKSLVELIFQANSRQRKVNAAFDYNNCPA